MMTHILKTKKGKSEVEKKLRKIVRTKLTEALDDYRIYMGENKFQTSLKKVARILSKDISGVVIKEAIKSQKRKNKKKKEVKNRG